MPYQALLLIRWNDYHCIQLIIADLLLTIGSFVASRDYEESRERSILYDTIKVAVEGICSSVPVILDMASIQAAENLIQPIESCLQGLFVLWPLCCALKATGIEVSRCNWIQERLRFIGDHNFIPQASALVCVHFVLVLYQKNLTNAGSIQRTNHEVTDVLAGLLLVRVSLSEDVIELFSGCGLA